MIKLGDAVIPYHDDFKLYITTKLPNPHYTPEVSVKVTVVNFTLAPRYRKTKLLLLFDMNFFSFEKKYTFSPDFSVFNSLGQIVA